jgi:tetratricopeptide (TPR) repeat protein
MLRTELGAGEKVRTIPGETVARMTLDLALGASDSLARDTLARVRANVGADLVVLGSYLALANGRVRLDLRLQDTTQGEVLATAAEEGTEEGLFELVSKSGARIRLALGIDTPSASDATAVRASFPASPQAARLYAEGLARLRVFDALAARDLLERAVQAEPDHPLAHSALASAWQALGYDSRAEQEAQRALDLAKGLPREDRLGIEAQLHEIGGRWERAVEIHRGLLVFFPESLDHGLRLAAAQTSAGKGKDALETVKTLRKLPPPTNADPRLDLAEAAAAKALTDFDRQRVAAAEAARKARALGARLVLAQARLQEGTAAFNLGEATAAVAACEEAGRIFTEAGDNGGLARTQNIVAISFAKQGDPQGARSRVEEALRSFRRIGDRRGTATQLANLGTLLSGQEAPTAAEKRANLVAARKPLEEALAISREIGHRSGIARDLNNLAVTLFELGDLPGARRTFEEVVAAFHALGESQNEAISLSGLGEVLLKQGALDAAEERLQASLRISRATDPGLAAESLGFLAEVRAKRGDQAGAQQAKLEAAALGKEAAKE